MLSKIYTPKQIEILKACRNSDWFMLINHGAKRSGKTQLDNDLFLAELRKVRQTADQLGIDTPQYILAGYSLGNIQDNILTELSNKYGFEFKFDKYNNFNLFGVKVIQTSHGSISGLGRIRGMTAFGAYINEASLANQEVFDEIKARCSGKGARIIADTNPDHPEHWLLKDYIKPGASGIWMTIPSWMKGMSGRSKRRPRRECFTIGALKACGFPETGLFIRSLIGRNIPSPLIRHGGSISTGSSPVLTGDGSTTEQSLRSA